MIRERVRPLKVLLVSPLDPKVPGDLKYLMGGENTYTSTLLANPPEGVVYVHLQQALKERLVRYHPLQRLLALLVKSRVLPLSSGSQCLILSKGFDLVHCHGYSIWVAGSTVPIILSDSSSNWLFLKHYVNWSKWRIALGYTLRRWLFDGLGVIDADTNLEKAKKLIVFSEFAKKIHLKLQASKGKLEVIYPGLPRPDFRNKGDKGNRIEKGKKRDKVNILFVGVWFERKGGLLVLEAFKRLSRKYENVRLTIIGQIPKNIKYQISNIKNYEYVPREQLMREFFPKADILVLVPPKVEGFGFVVLEAMSFGIPTIVSDVCVLPELVEDGRAGFVVKPGSVEELAGRLEVLVKNQALRKKMGEAARKRFEEKFSVNKMQKRLAFVYKEALS